MLVGGDVLVGLLLTATALIVRRRRAIGRTTNELGDIVTVILASFGLAILLVEGALVGFWMIVGYALYGGPLENHLLPGATTGRLVVTFSIGLVISTAAALLAYAKLLAKPGRRGSPPR